MKSAPHPTNQDVKDNQPDRAWSGLSIRFGQIIQHGFTAKERDDLGRFAREVDALRETGA
jgi:hypothetical protein